MKYLLILVAHSLLGLALAQSVAELDEFYTYHEVVGIPLAAEIYEYEMEMESNETTNIDNLSARIVNGDTIGLGARPFSCGLLIDLTNGYQSVCGSTLLSEKKSITAAHCWYDGRNQGKKLTVICGSITLYSGGTRIETSDVKPHEDWRPKTLTNDICMISHTSMELSDNIQTIPVGTKKLEDLVGTTATVSGFGRTASADRGRITKDQVLRKVELTVISLKDCQSTYGRYATEKNICVAGPKDKAKSTCQGDSGSGATLMEDNKQVVVGCVSFGGRRCDSPNPIRKVFTFFYMFKEWINKNMQD